MKIISHGDKREAIMKNAIYHCPECGCKWLSDIATECKKERHEYYGYLMFVCNCPE